MSAGLGIFILRESSLGLAEDLAKALNGQLYFASTEPKQYFRAVFRNHSLWLLVMATGIAVRFLDGLLVDKKSDPGVVVSDEAFRFAIALTGGHEGGANELAYKVSETVSSIPVITTATEALKCLTIGIGTRKGVSVAQIANAVNLALGERSLDEVRQLVTVDLKRNESAILAFSQENKIPLQIFAVSDLIARPFAGQLSTWVEHVTGAVAICEPCALLASPRGKLICPKFTHMGVAVAIVDDKRETYA